MTARPAGVEIAGRHDVPALFALLQQMHAEDGQAPLDPGNVMAMLCRGATTDRAIVGVIRGRRGVEASIGLFIDHWWYASEKHLIDRWNFVAPDHRRSPHARNLFAFAKWAASALGCPLVMSAFETPQTAHRVELYARQLPKAGLLFVYDPRLPKPASAA